MKNIVFKNYETDINGVLWKCTYFNDKLIFMETEDKDAQDQMYRELVRDLLEEINASRI